MRLCNEEGEEFARALINYSHEDVEKMQVDGGSLMCGWKGEHAVCFGECASQQALLGLCLTTHVPPRGRMRHGGCSRAACQAGLGSGAAALAAGLPLLLAILSFCRPALCRVGAGRVLEACRAQPGLPWA